MERCSGFDRCSRNLCPLDSELNLRCRREQDKCRYMRPPRRTKIKDKEFITGGSVMPDAILNFVPESNLEWLNERSRQRKSILDKNNGKKKFQ